MFANIGIRDIFGLGTRIVPGEQSQCFLRKCRESVLFVILVSLFRFIRPGSYVELYMSRT